MPDTFTATVKSHLSAQGFDCTATQVGDALFLIISKTVDGEPHRAEMRVPQHVQDKGAHDFIERALSPVLVQLKRNMRQIAQ